MTKITIRPAFVIWTPAPGYEPELEIGEGYGTGEGYGIGEGYEPDENYEPEISNSKRKNRKQS